MNALGDDFWWPLLSLAMGVFAYLLSKVVERILMRQRTPKAHTLYRERIIERLHYLLNLQAEVADCEQQLAELWEKAPDKQARLVVETVERARTLPRALLRMARRFGFDVPDEVQLDEVNAKPARPDLYQSHQPVGEEQPTESGNVITPAAWTGRAVGD
jgi:hypothetical protein